MSSNHPSPIKFESELLFWTGKRGTFIKTGEPSYEMANDSDSIRVWVNLSGNILSVE